MRLAVRRRLCRAIFCATCLLPTLVVGGAAVFLNTPVYRAARAARWRSRLTAQLGLNVQCSDMDWNDHGQPVARRIELRDLESRGCLARAQSATMARGEARPTIDVVQGRLIFSRLPRLMAVLNEHLMQRNASTGVSFELFANTLLLEKDSRSESLLDLRLALDVADTSTEAFLAFRPTGAAEDEMVRLRVVRNRQLDPPATGWELHTGSIALPCQLLYAWLPQLRRLGPTCTFAGSIWSEQLHPGWEAEISGVFHQLDLDQLVTGQFPHKLSGMAELHLDRLVVHQGRVVEAEGKLCSAGGVVSQTLIEATQKHLALESHAPLPEAMLLRYSKLSVQFSLTEGGLRLSADGGDERQTVLADSQGPLLSARDTEPLAPHALVKCLVPLNRMDVPASKETMALLKAIPLPAVNPVATADASDRYSPLNLRRE